MPPSPKAGPGTWALRLGPTADYEIIPVRDRGVDVVVGPAARHLRETARDEGSGAVVDLDEDEPPVAPIGAVLL